MLSWSSSTEGGRAPEVHRAAASTWRPPSASTTAGKAVDLWQNTACDCRLWPAGASVVQWNDVGVNDQLWEIVRVMGVNGFVLSLPEV